MSYGLESMKVKSKLIIVLFVMRNVFLNQKNVLLQGEEHALHVVGHSYMQHVLLNL
jgi:hypothetical protein